MTFSSFLISQFAFDEATEQYARFYQVDKENMDIYERCCKSFDYLIDCASGDNSDFDVHVEKDDLTVDVRLTLPCTLSEKEHGYDFAWIADWALSIETAYTDDGRVCLHFIFPSLWEERL